jgi:Xaa-Pro aminopeptidase
VNRQLASELMDRFGLDAVIGTSVESVRYALGYEVFEGDLNEFGQAVVIPRDDGQPPIAVLHSLEIGPLLDDGLDSRANVQLYSQYGRQSSHPSWAKRYDPLITDACPALSDAVSAALRRVGRGGKAAVEAHPSVSAGELGAKADGWQFVDHGQDILHLARLVKTPAEIEKLRHAAAVNEAAMQAVVVASGEYAIAEAGATFTQVVVEAGAVPMHLMVDDVGVLRHWGFGSRRRLMGMPGRADARLPRGVRLQYDAGLTYEGYWSDLGGTFFIGAEPSAEDRRIYGALSAGIETGIKHARPGMTSSRLNELILAAIRANGMPNQPARPIFGHFIGLTHGEGWLGQPVPTNSPFLPNPFDVELATDMVFNFELPHSVPGEAGYQYEMTVVISEDGAVPISPFKTLQVVV